ncbi:hypothetical protein HanRHA438_Chr14g0632441 [Helianthus annuus]|nr:hypothetical protein HanRHA438_Chr14g0632441 [Helianthus annuus]
MVLLLLKKISLLSHGSKREHPLFSWDRDKVCPRLRSRSPYPTLQVGHYQICLFVCLFVIV